MMHQRRRQPRRHPGRDGVGNRVLVVGAAAAIDRGKATDATAPGVIDRVERHGCRDDRRRRHNDAMILSW